MGLLFRFGDARKSLLYRTVTMPLISRVLTRKLVVSASKCLSITSVRKICTVPLILSRLMCRDFKLSPSVLHRCYSTDKQNVFEAVQANVPQDVKVFTYENSRLFRWVSLFGLVQFFFWGNLAFFSYYSLEGMQNPSSSGIDMLGSDQSGSDQLGSDQSGSDQLGSDHLVGDQKAVGREEQPENSSGRRGWWTTVIEMQQRNKNKIAFAFLSLGYIVLMFAIIYPLRTVAQLTLLKGGQFVRISTYNHLGNVRHYKVPLNDISCKYSRASKGPLVSMKVKGHWFYYMIDKRDGVFHNPKLFDYVIALNRFSK